MEKYTRIKEVMREKNTTATKVAENMGISVGTLSGIINGNPKVETLAKIAKVLGTEVKHLVK
jgi:transcriptional regulator with XRE-family HTH domain